MLQQIHLEVFSPLSGRSLACLGRVTSAIMRSTLRLHHLRQWSSVATGLQVRLPSRPSSVEHPIFQLPNTADPHWWAADRLVNDPFGSALIAAGLKEATLKAWATDPQVVPPLTDPGGDENTVSLFDTLEDLDASVCVERCAAISRANV
jgi:hypothetical protein|eukprot:COSAG02_NODE_5053_length_4691_cov_2.938807_2_plen_149_part_00